MKLITDDDKIKLSHLDILRIKSSKNKNVGIVLSRLSFFDKDLHEENLEILNTDYGEDELV